jgi:hypothetical protein
MVAVIFTPMSRLMDASAFFADLSISTAAALRSPLFGAVVAGLESPRRVSDAFHW